MSFTDSILRPLVGKKGNNPVHFYLYGTKPAYMAYDEKLAKRLRERFAVLPNVEEKEMMGGLTIMYNGKMCVGIIKDELMCRIDPEIHELVIERQGCRTMDFTQRPMKGYVLVDETGMKSKKDFEYWIGLALDYNPRAKAAMKKKKG